jgi:hypothetical protein
MKKKSFRKILAILFDEGMSIGELNAASKANKQEDAPQDKRAILQAFYNYVYDKHDCVLREEQIDLYLISIGEMEEPEDEEEENMENYHNLIIELDKYRNKMAIKNLSLPFVVLSNEDMHNLATFLPETNNDLAGIILPWQQKVYGEDILTIVNLFKYS